MVAAGVGVERGVAVGDSEGEAAGVEVNGKEKEGSGVAVVRSTGKTD